MKETKLHNPPATEYENSLLPLFVLLPSKNLLDMQRWNKRSEIGDCAFVIDNSNAILGYMVLVVEYSMVLRLDRTRHRRYLVTIIKSSQRQHC